MQPANIDDHLPLVLEGISQINIKTGEPCNQQDILEACRSQQAFLFVAPEGFCVLRPVHPATLHVWLTYSRTNGAVKKYMPFIIEKAKQIGATSITGRSPRKGWSRKLKGWKASGQNKYERQV